MTPDAGFLRSVLAAPDDDTPRLVYADWLSEHGREDRAVFIRAQCHNPGEPAPFALGQSLRYTPESPQKQIMGWLDSLGVRGGAFRRGFVEYLTLPAAAWLAHADAVLAAQPVREVRLTTLPPADWVIQQVAAGKALPPVAGVYADYLEMHRAALDGAWPGITFTLPPATDDQPRDERGRRTSAVQNVTCRAGDDVMLEVYCPDLPGETTLWLTVRRNGEAFYRTSAAPGPSFPLSSSVTRNTLGPGTFTYSVDRTDGGARVCVAYGLLHILPC